MKMQALGKSSVLDISSTYQASADNQTLRISWPSDDPTIGREPRFARFRRTEKTLAHLLGESEIRDQFSTHGQILD
jgi:hypothetical protein